MTKPSPYFSVIIPTRNRPSLFSVALRSALAQSWPEFEIVVVNDGSAPEFKCAYETILSDINDNRVRYLTLVPNLTGHGGGYARNFGVENSSAPYLCFLDDDDSWTDRDHLDRAQAVIFQASSPVDLYLANQVAFRDGVQQAGPIWVEDLTATLTQRQPDRVGAYTVCVEDLLRSKGFCHLNTLTVRRALFEGVGGFEETIRWEEDRDLYLRLIDRAGLIKYSPNYVARHNIPNPTTSSSMTTALSEVERRLIQLTVFDRARYLGRHSLIQRYGRLHQAYTLKRIAEALACAGRHTDAAFYARRALRTKPTLKWAGYTAWRTLRALAAQAPPALAVIRRLIELPK